MAAQSTCCLAAAVELLAIPGHHRWALALQQLTLHLPQQLQLRIPLYQAARLVSGAALPLSLPLIQLRSLLLPAAAQYVLVVLRTCWQILPTLLHGSGMALTVPALHRKIHHLHLVLLLLTHLQ